MKLLYVFPEPLPLDRARGIQTTHTVRALAARGMPVVLAHVPAATAPFGDADPASVERIALSHRLAWPLSGVHSNRIFLSRLLRAVRWSEIGAIFSRHLKVSRALLARFPEIPLVYEAHEVFTDTAPEPRRTQIAEMEREVLERATALIANSSATAERLAQRHEVEKQIHVIPNGVAYKANVPGKAWGEARDRVIYAGSFFGWKGVDDLVRAAGELEGFRIRLIGGDEASVSRLRASARPGGATLDFTGRIAHEDVAAELEAACIAVLPNRADTDSTFTSPIKLFEYMAAGCAVAASDIGALREVLDPDDAAWFPPGDPHALADAVRGLAADAGRMRAMAARLREKAKRYTWDARAERLSRVIEPLMSGR